jgi:hypothetical protein
MERELVRRPKERARAATGRLTAWALCHDRVYGALAAAALFFVAFFGLGCTPNVGSSCQLSTDCGSTGQLVCDTSEFEGYCTVVDCSGNECPDNAGCIDFNPAIPGCGYNDRVGGSRISQPFCMATCSSNSDCRLGYLCANPTLSPWYAVILDNNNQEFVCLPVPQSGQVGLSASGSLDSDAAVCQLLGPTFDANFTPVPEASSPDGNESEAGESEAGRSEAGVSEAGDAASKGD